MKRTLSMIALAVLTVGLLGSCSKINERLDNLEKKVDGIENEQIASINTQIANIESSIADLKQIRDDIGNLKQTAENHGQDIFALQEADETLGNRIDNLEDYLKNVLPNYAEKEWVEATYSTLEQYDSTCTAIAEINVKIGELDTKLSEDIETCADSLTKWINVKFAGYYTSAEMDAKLAQMRAAIDSAKASGKITDTKADSVASELTKTKTAVDTAKSHIRSEYKAAIKTAIDSTEGKLTKKIQEEITKVNERIDILADKVTNLSIAVDALERRVDNLEKMIQSVKIIPEYANGSVRVEEDTLYIDCVIAPSAAVEGLTKDKVRILLNKVQTKAVALDTVPTDSIKVFTKDAKNGTVSIKANIAELIPSNDTSLTVAVNVKVAHSNNLKSDYTTEFVPVYIAGPALPDGALSGEFTVNAEGKKVRFSQGNLYAKKESEVWKWHFYDEQYKYNSLNSTCDEDGCRTATGDDIEIDLFTWGYDKTSTKTSYSLNPVNTAGISGHTTEGDKQFSASEDWGYVFGGESSVWRTLTSDEWKYLFNTRTFNGGTGEGKSYQRATIKLDGTTGVYGMILYPDNYTSQKAETEYSVTDWDAMEAAGCVFLPAAGDRDGSDVADVGANGFYWLSSANDKYSAYIVYFDSATVSPGLSGFRSCGYSVRLITECQ